MEHAQSITARTTAPAGDSARTTRFARLHWIRAALVVGYVLWVVHFYVPGAGFTRLIMLPADSHVAETPVMQATPHAHGAAATGYDGQYYAHLALDPLLKDLATDRVLDNPPYRARRILCSWIAWLAGFGRPFWVLQAYALENVAAWLLLAWWLHRRLPAPDVKSLVVWAGCLFCHGLLTSTRLALLDGPSLLILVAAVSAIERGRTTVGSGLVGGARRARATNLLGVLSLPPPWPPRPRRLLAMTGRLLLCVAPLLLWLDYLRSVYGRAALSAAGGMAFRFHDIIRYFRLTAADITGHGLATTSWFAVAAIVAVVTQAAFLVARPRWRSPWWRLGLGYVVLALMLDKSVWEGQPGAFTRVLLPLQLTFNLLAMDSRRFWWVIVPGNLSVVAGLRVFLA